MATTSCRSLDGDTEGVAPDKLRQHGLLKAIGSVDVESEKRLACACLPSDSFDPSGREVQLQYSRK